MFTHGITSLVLHAPSSFPSIVIHTARDWKLGWSLWKRLLIKYYMWKRILLSCLWSLLRSDPEQICVARTSLPYEATACTKLHAIWNHYTSMRVRVHVATIKILLARIAEHALDTTHAVWLSVYVLAFIEFGLTEKLSAIFLPIWWNE